MSLDAQKVIDTATAASASLLGATEAAQIFRTNVKNARKVTVSLPESQKILLQEWCPYPIIFMGGPPVTNDHPLLVAARNLCRDELESAFQISTTNERTLIVGAACREVKKYWKNPQIHYYIHGGDNKDYDRVVRPMLKQIVEELKVRSRKKDRRTHLPPGVDATRLKPRPVLKRYEDARQLYNDYVNLHRMPSNIHTEAVPCNTLVFEDSIYNFDKVELSKLFKRTGANIAYGYAVLPLDLIFPDLPVNTIYSVDSQGDQTTLTWKSGYCNGYSHKTTAWETLLKYVAWEHEGISLAVEITSRVGPLAVFKIYRCAHPERIVRELSVPENFQYVKVLDLIASVNRQGRVNTPLKYVSVCISEFMDVYNYACALDSKSLTFSNLMVYVRRRSGGISLVTKELVKAWNLPPVYHHRFVMIVFIYVKTQFELQSKIFGNIGVGSWTERVKGWFRKLGNICFPFVAKFLDWLARGNLADQLVLWPNTQMMQTARISAPKQYDKFKIGADLHCDVENSEDVPDCYVCASLQGQLGEQVIRCKKQPNSKHNFKLTTEELSLLKTKLIDTDNDPPGLKKVKEEANQNVPSDGFEYECQVFYLRAGPGTGKSFTIRKMADKSDLVLAPFTKLKADYEDLLDGCGDKYDLLFKTTHRALKTRGSKRIFVDEFTSFPYEYLACVAKLNAAEEIWLVGDERQTRVQDPEEGIYIGNKINLEELTTHELVYNFRNPRDCVAILNKRFGYTMGSKSKIQRGFKSCQTDAIPEYQQLYRFAFSKATAASATGSEKNTVRSTQGGTFPNTALYITDEDLRISASEALRIVALSRHKNDCVIVGNDGLVRQAFVDSLELLTITDEEIDQLLNVPVDSEAKPEGRDKVVEDFLDDCDRRNGNFDGEDDDDDGDDDAPAGGGGAEAADDQPDMSVHSDEVNLDDSFFERQEQQEPPTQEGSPDNAGENVDQGACAGAYFADGPSERDCSVDSPDLDARTFNAQFDAETSTMYSCNPSSDFDSSVIYVANTPEPGTSPEATNATSANPPISADPRNDVRGEVEGLSEFSVSTDIGLLSSVSLDSYISASLRVAGDGLARDWVPREDHGSANDYHKLDWLLRQLNFDTKITIDLCANPGQFARRLYRDCSLSELYIHEFRQAPYVPVRLRSSSAKVVYLNDSLTNYFSSVRTGDLTIAAHFDNLVSAVRNHCPNACTLACADGDAVGGKLFSVKEAEWLLVKEALVFNGSMIMRLRDTGNARMQVMLNDIAKHFGFVEVVKTPYCNPYTDEKYLLAQGFLNSTVKISVPHMVRVTDGESLNRCIATGKCAPYLKKVVFNHDSIFVTTNRTSAEELIDMDQRFKLQMDSWMICPNEFVKELKLTDLDVPVVWPTTHPVKDAYLLGREVLPAVTRESEILALNEATSVLVGELFNTGKTSADQLMAPLNARNHPVKMEKTFFSASAGLGNHFCSKNPLQTLQVLQVRYFNAPKKFELTEENKQLAVQIVDLWFSENVMENPVTQLDLHEIDVKMKEFKNDMVVKNYLKSFEGVGGFDDSNARTIRFTLKDIFKPKVGVPDLTKAGQGISAWSVSACIIFCGIFRTLTQLVSKTEKSHVMTDAYTDESAFMCQVRNEFARLPDVADNGVTDGETFDANQNAWTQYLERLYWLRMGISEQFLDMYYSFRRNYPVTSSVGFGKALEQKTSGEPGTLVNNGVVSKLVSNAIVRGEGRMAIVYKGDDFCKRQLNLKIDEDMMARVDKACALKLRVTIGEGAEFCGLVYYKSLLVPSIPRKVVKILSHRFRDYKHFCEYQASLRDFIIRIGNLKEFEVVVANAAIFKVEPTEMEFWLDIVKSYSHIREDQFEEVFKKRVERYSLPQYDNVTGTVRVMLQSKAIPPIGQTGEDKPSSKKTETLQRKPDYKPRSLTLDTSSSGEAVRPAVAQLDLRQGVSTVRRMPGYTNWGPRHEVLLEGWAEVRTIMKVLKTMEGISFSVTEGRNTARAAWAALNTEAPFSDEERFPEKRAYVSLNSGDWPRKVLQLTSSLDYHEDPADKAKRVAGTDTPSAPRVRLDDATLSFRNAICAMRQQIFRQDGVYSRSKFEDEYRLNWS